MKKIVLTTIITIVLFTASCSEKKEIKRDITQEEDNKKLVRTFYQSLIGDKDISAIDTFLAEDFVQHNPNMLDGSDALKKAFSADFANAPKIKIDFRNIAADGDLVFLHLKMKNPKGKFEAVADVFRVKDNKIVELWDVVQEIPEKAANAHPMFDNIGKYNPSKRNIKLEESNKAMVLAFYQQLFGDKDVSAIDTYLSTGYIQHNPSVADGNESLKAAVTKWFVGAKKEKIEVNHLAADGDLVFIHKREKSPEGKLTAIMDIFRVKNNKIVEHWDVIQEAPKNSINPHPMF
jgi:predicted SnoaL-like aldol condensation-catalyzing enzyme